MRNLSIKSKYRISEIDVLILLSAFCTFTISYLTYVSNLIHLIYYAFQALIIFFGILYVIKYRKYDVTDLLLVLFIAVEFLSTFINHGAFKELILNTKTILLLYAVFKWVFSWKPKDFIRVMARYSTFLVVLNTLSAVATYPKGLFYYDAFSPAFLLGGDNTSTRVYIISTVLCFLDLYFNHENKKYNFLTVISLINFFVFVFLRDIGNGKICIVVILISYLAFHICNIRMPKKPMRKIVTGNYILFLLLVIFEGVRYFEYIIVAFLGRDLTLSTRTTIWEITLEKISENLVWGNGYVTGTQFEEFLPSIIGVNAHNTILMIAFVGGCVLSVIFLLLMNRAAKEYDEIVTQSEMWFMPVCFLAMFLRSQVEGGDEAYLIAMVALIINVAKLWVQKSKATNVHSGRML